MCRVAAHRGLHSPYKYPSDNKLLGTSFQKPARGPPGAKSARASAFIGVFILMDTEALAGFAMPARASAFNTF